MEKLNINSTIKDFLNILNKVKNKKNNKVNKKQGVGEFDYKQAKESYYFKLYKSKFNSLISLINNTLIYSSNNEKNQLLKLKENLEKNFELNNFEQIEKDLLKNINLFEINVKGAWIDKLIKKVNKQKLPSEIKKEILYDLEEIVKCYKTKAYRSSIILCARILEIALHRKYYDATGIDLLEKAPGIGLGNLIAKLKEKGIKIDPALTQQIHLINQIRIFSVHKKEYFFDPSKEQVQAIILYTIDLINKLFN